MAEVIVAFDVPTAEATKRLADQLPGLRWAKVGPVALLEGGPDVVRWFKRRGVRVFLDMKWHDIPNTVAEAVRAAERLGVDLVTVHALGGESMLRAAVAARRSVRIVAVTVLTSHTAEEYSAVVRRDVTHLPEEARRLAAAAARCGLDGVVTSPLEIEVVRSELPADAWIVVPGIRPSGAPAGDQRRTATPEWAAARGATHLVVGRPILEAKDPSAVYHSVCEASK
ncbi:MAG TPA: orotidine-5'-phosphate decarboxylase [Gemmatimonadales bacterium]|nr:orotidine-5'-phosphate decarboxylase [Gemmatimonadales bacterium]